MEGNAVDLLDFLQVEFDLLARLLGFNDWDRKVVEGVITFKGKVWSVVLEFADPILVFL